MKVTLPPQPHHCTYKQQQQQAGEKQNVENIRPPHANVTKFKKKINFS